jgi:hypothetical protein
MGLQASTPKMKCELIKEDWCDVVQVKVLNPPSDLPSWFPPGYCAYCDVISGKLKNNRTYVVTSVVPSFYKDTTDINMILVPRFGEVVRISISKKCFIADALFEKPMYYSVVPFS